MANPNNNKQPNHKQKLRQRIKQKHENQVAHREEVKLKQQQRFTEAPTGKEAQHQARAYAGAEYTPVIRGIRGELASSVAKQKKENEWYNQLGAEQAQAATAQEGAAQQFGSSLTQQLSAANAQNASYLANQQQAQQAQSALTGQPLIASSGEAAAAGANIGALQGVALNAPTQEANYSQAALTRRLGIGSREQGHALANEQIGARKGIRQDLQAAQKQKGQAYVGRLGELKESARKQELDKKAFALEGQEAQAQREAEAAKIEQDEVQNKRQAATTRRGQNVSAASSAASTAASVEGNQTSKQQAEIAAQKAHREQQQFNAERRYKKNHGGRTPAEVAAAKKEGQRNPLEKREKGEELKTAYQTAHRVYNLLRNSKEFKTLAPAEQWALLEEAVAKRGVEGELVSKAVAKIKASQGPTEAAAKTLQPGL